jgi:hypothetical protein
MLDMLIILSILISVSLLFNTLLLVALQMSNKREKKCLQWITLLRDRFNECLVRMRDIDNMQIFEKDDDVGVTFSTLVSVIKEIDQKIDDGKL